MKPMEETPFLTLESTFGDAEEVVARAVDPLVPVVDSDKHMALQVCRELHVSKHACLANVKGAWETCVHASNRRRSQA